MTADMDPHRLHPQALLLHALQEAQRLDHDVVGTEHLLLALLVHDNGTVAGLLSSRRVSIELARDATARRPGQRAALPTGEAAPALTWRAEQALIALRRVTEQSDDAQQRVEAAYMATIHDDAAGAVEVLQGLGIGIEFLRHALAGQAAPPRQVPNPPDMLTAAGSDGQALVSWSASPAAAEGYRLYRNGQPVYTGPGTSFMDMGLRNGIAYMYWICVLNQDRREGRHSDPVTAVPRRSIAPRQPERLLLTETGAGVRLLWPPVQDPELAGYRLYRDGQRIYEGTAPENPDRPVGEEHRYAVTAYDSSGNESSPAEAEWPQEPARGCLWTFLAVNSTRLVSLLAFPGLVTRLGTRVLLAKLLGVRIVHSEFSTEPGGAYRVLDRAPPWRRVLLELGPATVALVVGAVNLLPILITSRTTGVSPLPSLTRDPAAFVSHDPGFGVFAEAIVWRGAIGLLQLWIGMAAWYCALPSPTQLRTARRQLTGRDRRAQVDAHAAPARPRWLALSLATALLPLYVVAKLLDMVDRVGLWLGFNVYLASGGVTLLGLTAVATGAVDRLFS
jgi:hypothetical protein